MNNTYLDHYQQGYALGNQALQAEAVQNFQLAANLYDQAITHITHSINMLQQAGQFASDYTYYLLGFSYYRAALIQTNLGLPQIAQNYLFHSLNVINRAITLNSNMFQYHSLAGDILLAQGNMIEAERAFLTALQLNQMDARSSWMLGFLYSSRQQTVTANQYYQTAYKIEPNIPPIPTTSSNSSSSNWLNTIVKISTVFKNLSPSSVNIHNCNFQEGINSITSHINQTHSGSGDNISRDFLLNQTHFGSGDNVAADKVKQTINRYTRIDFPSESILEHKTELVIQLVVQIPEQTRSLQTVSIATNSKVKLVKLNVQITAENFTIQQRRKQLTLPVDSNSEEVIFQLVPIELGEQMIEIEFFYDGSRVGYAIVKTDVKGSPI